MSSFKKLRRKRRVLVVDDEVINRELLEAVLSLNYEVTSVMNGSEAMNALRSAKEPYSLILLDLLMPEKSGFQVLEECKADEELKRIPIIVMTSEKSAEVRSIRMGAEDFIAKPYRMPEVIIARCERIIELSEEKALIRSIEKDPVTRLYIKLFFDAYINRYKTEFSDEMDAVYLKAEGLSSLGEDEKNDFLKKLADLTKSVILRTKGIACRNDDDAFLIYCRHKNNYDRLIERIKNELADELQRYNIVIKAGVCENTDSEKPSDLWYEQAKAAYNTIDSTETAVAVYTE